MAAHQRKDSNSRRAVHAKVARAIFAATEAAGILDREVAEKIAEHVIQRLDQGHPGAEVPFPGMEEFDALEEQQNDATQALESKLEQFVDRGGMKYTTLVEVA